jgi:WD40 repeat protein
MLGHEGRGVFSVAFSPDGKQIVSGSGDKTVRLRDTETRTQIGESMLGHKVPVYSVAFSPDGKRIVSGSEDKNIWLWDAATGKQIGEPLQGHGDYVLSVALSNDGKRIVSGSRDEEIRVWDGPDAWIDLVCAKLVRNMSEEEWRHHVGDIPYETQCPGLPVPKN